MFPLDVCRFEEFGSADDWTGRVAVVIFGAGVVGIEPVDIHVKSVIERINQFWLGEGEKITFASIGVFLVSDVKPKLTLLVRQGWSFTIYQVTFSLNSICCFFPIASTNNGQVDNKIGKQLFSLELQVDIY